MHRPFFLMFMDISGSPKNPDIIDIVLIVRRQMVTDLEKWTVQRSSSVLTPVKAHSILSEISGRSSASQS